MRRLLLLCLAATGALILGASRSTAQVATSYTFTTGSGSLNSASTTIISANIDNGSSSVRSIGWTNGFVFNGIAYTHYSVNSNGLMALHTSSSGPAVSPTLTGNDLAGLSSSAYPIIAPFWDDQITRSTGVRTTSSGSSPNRILTVQWQTSPQSGTTSAVYTYQVRLHEGSGKIEFYYSSMSTAYTTSATIGVAASSTDFISATPAATLSSSSTISNNSINLSSSSFSLPGGTLYAAIPRAVTTYSFTSGTGDPTDMTGATTINTFNSTDDGNSGEISLPFTFTFNGSNHTSFNANVNGWMKLGGATTSTGITNSLQTISYNVFPVIAPFWEDMHLRANGSVSYKTTGTSPNRVFTIQWVVATRSGNQSLYYTYQVRLHEGSDKIEFYYENMPTTQSTSASIGIATSPANYISVTPGTSPTTSSATGNNSINLATATTRIAPGTLYTFTSCEPHVATHPQSRTVCEGAVVGLNVATVGTNLSYQWRKNGVEIPGATAPVLNFLPTTANDAGEYDVIVSTPCSPADTSNVAVLVVNTPPVIVQQPSSQAVCIGSPITLSVGATGSALQYQWKKNGVDIPGETTPTFTIPALELSDEGVYAVTIRGICGTPVTSSVTAILVTTPPVITEQPASDRLCLGQPLELNVAAMGSNLTYQWRKDGQIIPGATAATYRVPVSSAADAGSYDVTVYGICSTATSQTFVVSNTVTVEVNRALTVVSSPVAQTVCQNTPVTMTASATGDLVGYQWRKDGINIPGATNPTYTIASAQGSHDGVYDVMITSGMCSQISYTAPARLTVNILPAITKQPTNVIACRNTPATMKVEAIGSGLTYQWRKSGVPIPGANDASYTIEKTMPADAGTYDVVIGGICAPTVQSTSISLTINIDPTLYSWSGAQSVRVGEQARFSVNATGTTLQYQWYKDGKALPNSNSSTYTINSVRKEDGGKYYVAVTNMCAMPVELSGTMYLFVEEPASIASHPQSISICEGSLAEMSVTAGGTAVRYQWRKNGTNIPGATTPALSIPAATIADGGSYDVVVSDQMGGSVTSNAATLTVNPTTAITTEPQAQKLCEGQQLTLSVTATGAGLTYQWRKDGVEISGANAPTYSITSSLASDAGSYDVVVTGTCGTQLTSSPVEMKVDEPAAISEHPASTTVNRGATVTLSVSATGTEATYQWRKDTQPISGATTASYTITSAALSDGGRYDVVVTAACGNPVTSNAATLTVNNPIGAVTGIDESRAAGASLHVVPNPAHGLTRLEITLPSIARIDRATRLVLFDVYGNEALDLSESFRSGDRASVLFDASRLPSGTYYCRFEGSGWSGTIGSLVIRK